MTEWWEDFLNQPPIPPMHCGWCRRHSTLEHTPEEFQTHFAMWSATLEEALEERSQARRERLLK